MEQGKPLTATDSPLVDFDAVCQRVRAAIEPARVHAVSLHDEKGDVLWLTESSMGPDEHNAAREGFETFTHVNAAPVVAYDLGDSRSAVLFRVVNARRAMVGAVMAIMDTRGVKQDAKGAALLMTPKLQRALVDFAGMRPDTAPPPAAARAPAVASAPAVLRAPVVERPPASSRASAETRPPATSHTPAAARPATLERTPAKERPPAASRAPAAEGAPAAVRTPVAERIPAVERGAPAMSAPAPKPSTVRAPQSAPPAGSATAAPIELSLADSVRIPKQAAPPPVAARAPNSVVPERHQAPSVTPEIDRLHAALRSSPIALHVQRLVPLTKGSQLKRYEVLLRAKSDDAANAAPHSLLKAAVENGLGSVIDRRVVTELIGWLAHHPEVWQTQAVMFSVNLTSTALQDEHFINFVGLCLAKSPLPKAMIGFEIDVSTAVHLGDKIVEVAAALHRLGCPVVLDDFKLRTECFDLLRLPAVRYIKLASAITAKMRSDKLAQAAITAVVQMARVLGMHTVAKRTETAAEQEWLTALGVDFIQSNALSPAIAMESLSKPQKTAKG